MEPFSLYASKEHCIVRYNNGWCASQTFSWGSVWIAWTNRAVLLKRLQLTHAGLLERGPHRNEPSSKLVAEEFSNELYILHANLPCPSRRCRLLFLRSASCQQQSTHGRDGRRRKKTYPACCLRSRTCFDMDETKEKCHQRAEKREKACKGRTLLFVSVFSFSSSLLRSFVDQNELAELFLVGRVETKETFRVRRKGNRRRETEQTRALCRRK